MATVACQATYSTHDLEILRQAIRQRTIVEYYIDDLPLRLFVGTLGEAGWFDFDETVLCEEPPAPTERLYLLPHAHFILGRFGTNRLTSARLVTDVSG